MNQSTNAQVTRPPQQSVRTDFVVIVVAVLVGSHRATATIDCYLIVEAPTATTTIATATGCRVTRTKEMQRHHLPVAFPLATFTNAIETFQITNTTKGVA